MIIRRCAALSTILALALSTGFGCTADDGSDEGGSSLALGLSQAEPERRFAFTYEATGSEVLDCVLPHRRFTVTVDTEEATLDVRDEANRPLAHRRGATLMVAAEVFRGPISERWVEVDDWPAAEQLLRRAFGPDLSSYLLVNGLPATLNDYARDLADAAVAVTSTLRGFELEFDESDVTLAGATALLTVEDGRVTALDVVARPDGGAMAGFRVVYGGRPFRNTPRNAIGIDEVLPNALEPAAAQSCAL